MSARREIGESFEIALVDDLPRSRLVTYAGASGDFNPLHTDEVFARDVAGLPTVMVQGMLTMGMTATALVRVFGDDALTAYSGRFLAQVWPGDDLRVRIDVVGESVTTRGRECDVSFETRNQEDQVVFSGTARALSPIPSDSSEERA